MKSRRTVLKQAIACTLPSIPALSANSIAPVQVDSDLDDEQAYCHARYLCWSKETEETWLQLLGIGLKSLNTSVTTSDLKEELVGWCTKISTSLKEWGFFCIETSKFKHKEPMLSRLVAAIREKKTPEETVIHCLDLIRLISPIHHFLEGDHVDRDEPLTVVDRLMRLKCYHSEIFLHLANATLSLDAERMKHELNEWSVELEGEKRQDALLQMNEGLALLRSEPLIA